MNKVLKILLGVAVFLGILSSAFLLFAKKKPLPVEAPKTVQASAQVNSLAPLPVQQNKAVTPTKKPVDPQAATQDRKAFVRLQWNQCQEKTVASNTNLIWNVKITEVVPAGGTNAKGSLNGEAAFPVQVILRSDSQIADKIKAMLVVGKTAFLRGNCTDVTTDGAVVLQVF